MRVIDKIKYFLWLKKKFKYLPYISSFFENFCDMPLGVIIIEDDFNYWYQLSAPIYYSPVRIRINFKTMRIEITDESNGKICFKTKEVRPALSTMSSLIKRMEKKLRSKFNYKTYKFEKI